MNDAERESLYQLERKLFHRQAEVRIRAALDLGEHPHARKELQPLIDALDDRDRAVREVVFDALGRTGSSRRTPMHWRSS